MKLTCAHCGDTFTITADQLGSRGKCPHCKATIILPKAISTQPQTLELRAPSLWMERWFSALAAGFLHVLILVTLLMIPARYFAVGENEQTAEVVLGVLDRQVLTDETNDVLQEDRATAIRQSPLMDAFSEEILSPNRADEISAEEFDVRLLAPSGAAPGAFDMRSARKVDGDSLAEQGFTELLSQLKQDGLEIVITFDSTGSMEGEIQEVKNKIQRIGSVLFRMIPKTRIGVCTYRDVGDSYVVKGQPLTDNLGDIVNFLEDISAAGGGDDPEAVDEGLNWAITQNVFRSRARKVVLLFGDAAPHAENKDRCLRLARDFRHQFHGVVSTVTCHSNQRLPAFIEIAQMGGGEAFLARDEREIVAQLVVLVFGSQYREKVLEAFNLLQR